MAVSFPNSVSSRVTSSAENPATNDLSHTVTSGTTLLLCFVATTAAETCSGITWNGVSLTEVSKVDPSSSSSGDAGGSLWALANPTPATANFEVSSSTGNWGNWHIKGGLNVHGSVSSSVSDAISELSNDENKSATNTNVHSSGGSSGNKLLFFGVGIGDDMVPAANDAAFTELAEIQSAGGAGNNQDGCVYLAEKNAPSSITVTFGASDENAGSLYEIIAAADPKTGSGSADGLLPTITGVGEREVTGTSTLDSIISTVSGVGEREITATSTLNSLISTVSGVGERTVKGTDATVEANPGAVSGVGEREIKAVGSASVSIGQVAGVGERTIVSVGSATAASAAITAAGKRVIKGAASVDGVIPTIAATGIITKPGTFATGVFSHVIYSQIKDAPITKSVTVQGL